jgi:hypothetical protein
MAENEKKSSEETVTMEVEKTVDQRVKVLGLDFQKLHRRAKLHLRVDVMN